MPGSDLKLSEARTEGYRHFANKIWNASRFSLMKPGGFGTGGVLEVSDRGEYTLPDQWIRGRLNRAIREIRQSLEAYKFN